MSDKSEPPIDYKAKSLDVANRLAGYALSIRSYATLVTSDWSKGLRETAIEFIQTLDMAYTPKEENDQTT